jgi:hypothetical protein
MLGFPFRIITSGIPGIAGTDIFADSQKPFVELLFYIL